MRVGSDVGYCHEMSWVDPACVNEAGELLGEPEVGADDRSRLIETTAAH
jgi:hypothetical protein